MFDASFTCTSISFSEELPAASVTVSLTLYLPLVLYLYFGRAPVFLSPFPRSHANDLIFTLSELSPASNPTSIPTMVVILSGAMIVGSLSSMLVAVALDISVHE